MQTELPVSHCGLVANPLCVSHCLITVFLFVPLQRAVKVLNLSDDPNADYMPRDTALADGSGFVALAVASTLASRGCPRLSADDFLTLFDAVRPGPAIWAEVADAVQFVMELRGARADATEVAADQTCCSTSHSQSWRRLPLEPWEAALWLKAKGGSCATVSMSRVVQVGEASPLGVRCEEDSFVDPRARDFVIEERPFRGIAE